MHFEKLNCYVLNSYNKPLYHQKDVPTFNRVFLRFWLILIKYISTVEKNPSPMMRKGSSQTPVPDLYTTTVTSLPTGRHFLLDYIELEMLKHILRTLLNLKRMNFIFLSLNHSLSYFFPWVWNFEFPQDWELKWKWKVYLIKHCN